MNAKKLLSVLLALAMMMTLTTALAVSVSATETTGNEKGTEEFAPSETGADSTEIEQKYNLTVKDGKFTNVTKVNLAWEISDINASREDAKVWNPETLTWDDDNDNDEVKVDNNGTATFNLTNLSSVKVDITASFKAETGFSPKVEYSVTDGKLTLNTVVKADKTTDTGIDNTGAITVTVTPGESDFDTNDATKSATKYGTYTITIATNNQ